jgi:hypothetical protein
MIIVLVDLHRDDVANSFQSVSRDGECLNLDPSYSSSDALPKFLNILFQTQKLDLLHHRTVHVLLFDPSVQWAEIWSG